MIPYYRKVMCSVVILCDCLATCCAVWNYIYIWQPHENFLFSNSRSSRLTHAFLLILFWKLLALYKYTSGTKVPDDTVMIWVHIWGKNSFWRWSLSSFFHILSVMGFILWHTFSDTPAGLLQAQWHYKYPRCFLTMWLYNEIVRLLPFEIE